jgi:arylsulfatase A-like enzyme/Flp pilus assembly protein TadD
MPRTPELPTASSPKASGTPKAPRLAGAFQARLPVAFVLAVGLAAAVGGCERVADRQTRPVPPTNILLITIDTLRADALGAYGNSGAATPWMDRLAAGGVRFASARAHNVLTLPSHANILTGQLPQDHGIRDNAGFRLRADEPTLATRLKALGFRTGAFVSAFPLDSRFGLGRGFDVYEDSFVDATPRPSFLEQERPGAETVAAALRWIQDGKASGSWFAWVHVYEPHYPYAPPAPFASRFPRDPYAGEVAATDAALAPLLQPIVDAGPSGNTLVVLTSDHGESLGDHGEATHGIFAYEATLRVPLVLYYPPLLQPRVMDADASHVDIVPMILETLGVSDMSGLRGRTLGAIAKASATTMQETYFEALSGSLNRGWAPLTGIVSNGMKFIDLPLPELYDLRADPGESRNLAESQTQQAAELRQRLRSLANLDVRRIDETSEVKDRLRALGYVGSGAGGTRKAYTEADDPKRLIGVEGILQEVIGLYLEGKTQDALARARTLVAQHPDMRLALLQLAHLERESGNVKAGIAALRHLLRVHPADTEAASLLGAYLTAANRTPEAIAVLQPYAAPPDADVQVLTALSLAYAKAGRFPDATQTLDRARRNDPSNAMLLVTGGTIELMAGRRPQARAAFESALGINEKLARAHSSLGAMDAEEGRHENALQHWRQAVALDPGEYEKLLVTGVSLARNGHSAAARPYLKLFADAAPSNRYAADIARARDWLRTEAR